MTFGKGGRYGFVVRSNPLLLILLALALAACDSETEPQSAGSGDGPAQLQRFELEAYCVEVATVACRLAASCNNQSLFNDRHQSLEDCHASLLTDCKAEGIRWARAVDVGAVRFDGRALQSCLSNLGASSCNDAAVAWGLVSCDVAVGGKCDRYFFGSALADPDPSAPGPLAHPFESCAQVLVGTLAEGGSCYHDRECSSGHWCDEEATCPGRCRTYLQRGDQCPLTPEACAPGLWCSGVDLKKCRLRALAGEECVTADPGGPKPACEAPLVCLYQRGEEFGRCVRLRERSFDPPCAALAECAVSCGGNAECRNGCSLNAEPEIRNQLTDFMECLGDSGCDFSDRACLERSCPEPTYWCLGSDGACGDYRGRCMPDSYCAHKSSTTPEGTCSPFMADGDECNDTLGAPRPCGAGLHCFGPGSDSGVPGRPGIKGRCRPYPEVEEACVRQRSNCVSSYCAMGGGNDFEGWCSAYKDDGEGCAHNLECASSSCTGRSGTGTPICAPRHEVWQCLRPEAETL